MALVNSWLLYKRACRSLSVPKNKINKLSEFKARVSEALMHSGKLTQKSKRGRPSLENSPAAQRKSNQGLPMPEDDIRFDHLGHLPQVGTSRHMCKQVDCKSRIVTFCIKCNVYLCIKQEKNCFVSFHSK